ncbi:MAG: hypothetical protein ACTSYF_05110 [Promethearchaeota archaeon]
MIKDPVNFKRCIPFPNKETLRRIRGGSWCDFEKHNVNSEKNPCVRMNYNPKVVSTRIFVPPQFNRGKND